MQVCIRFNPLAEGAYCLPLFLRIKDGKQLQLQLSAHGVTPSAQLALAVQGSHSCQLAAAPLGELQPPLQQYTLRNAGPAPLQYRWGASEPRISDICPVAAAALYSRRATAVLPVVLLDT